MKILMLGWELPPHNSGGLGVACLNMARALCREGNTIDFVVPYTAQHDAVNFMHILNATSLDPIHRFGGGAYTHHGIEEKIISRGSGESLSIRDIQHEYQNFIEEYLMQYKPDVVHAHDWLTFEAGMLAKRDYNIPLVAHVHATEYDRAGMHTGNPLIHEIEHEGLLMADRIIAVSDATRHIIHDKYHIPLDRIDVVYNSLDEDFLKNDYEYDPGLHNYITTLKKSGYTIISTVGRFTIQKGLDYLLDAAATALSYNRKLLFVFAGDGEERNHLIARAANLGISKNVVFTGFVRGQRLRDIYSASDIFVMSSISEPFGLTALEAAHHGDALILTKQSGVSEVIWSAMKYDFWDRNKLADEILSIAENSALKDSLKVNAAHEYSQFSWDKVAKKCQKIYNNVKHKR